MAFSRLSQGFLISLALSLTTTTSKTPWRRCDKIGPYSTSASYCVDFGYTCEEGVERFNMSLIFSQPICFARFYLQLLCSQKHGPPPLRYVCMETNFILMKCLTFKFVQGFKKIGKTNLIDYDKYPIKTLCSIYNFV